MPCLRTKVKTDDGCEELISLYNVKVNNRWSFAKNTTCISA